MKATLTVNDTEVTLEGRSESVTEAVEELTDTEEHRFESDITCADDLFTELPDGYSAAGRDFQELRERIADLRKRLKSDHFDAALLKSSDKNYGTVSGVPVVLPNDSDPLLLGDLGLTGGTPPRYTDGHNW